MHNSTRRKFLQKSALVTMGAATGAIGTSLGETESESALRRLDGDLAQVLRSYGRAHRVKTGGTQKAHDGTRIRRFPVSRVGIEVRDQESFRRSFEKLTKLSDRVLVEGNTTKFVRGGHYFVIENRVA